MGKTLLLEAEEIGGLRVFKYSFIATDTQETDDKGNQTAKSDGSDGQVSEDPAKQNADTSRDHEVSDPTKPVDTKVPKSIGENSAARTAGPKDS